MSNEPQDEKWTLVLAPRRGWFDLRLGEIWRYRELILLFVRRDFIASFKQTILGPLWFFVQPVLTTIIFTIVFGGLAGLAPDGPPKALFYLTGIVSWGYFAECLTKTAGTFVTNASIFGKVYFPRIVLPVSVVISGLMRFLVQFVLLLGVWIYYLATDAAFQPRYELLALIPVLLLISAGLGLGFGIIISSVTTKYRDLQQLVGFGVQLLMYLSPVIFPMAKLSEKWQHVIMLNPMSAVIEYMRAAFLGTTGENPMYLLYSAGFMLVLLFGGLLLFNRVERTFIDTV